MNKKILKTLSIVLSLVVFLLSFSGCGEETVSSDVYSVAEVSKDEFLKQYAESTAAYKQNAAVQFNEKSEIAYKRYKTTVRSSISTDIGITYGEEKNISAMRVNSLWVEGDDSLSSAIAYEEGRIYNEIVKSDFEQHCYTSEEKEEDVLGFLYKEMKISYFDENVDITKFAKITKENITDNGYSIVIAEPAAEYLTELYVFFKNCIESKLDVGSKMVSFEGVFNYDTAGKLLSREFVYTAQESENESVTVKNILTVNKTNTDVVLEKISNKSDYKNIDSVLNLYYLNAALNNVNLQNGSVTSEETISMKGIVDITQKTKTTLNYTTQNDKLTFDAKKKVTSEVLGIKDTQDDTESYSDGLYKSVTDGKYSSKRLTEVEAASKLKELCVIVPFDVSDITGISYSNKDGVEKYTFSVGEQTLKDYIAPVLELKERKEGEPYGFDETRNLKVDQNKSKAEVTIKDGKIVKQSCTFVTTLTESGLTFDITIKQNLTLTEKEVSQ